MTTEEKIEIRFWLVSTVSNKLESENRDHAAGLTDEGTQEIVTEAMARYAHLPIEEVWRLLISLAGVHVNGVLGTIITMGRIAKLVEGEQEL